MRKRTSDRISPKRKVRVGYRRNLRYYKKSKQGRYLLLNYYLFDIKTGKDLIMFDSVCPRHRIWSWFVYFNRARGVYEPVIQAGLPNGILMHDIRVGKIKNAHKRVLKRRLYGKSKTKD